jgi:UDP-glucose 4-epimerase
MKILITGGCGYIGSHTIVDLLEAGYDVVNIDNCVRGSVETLDCVERITGKRVDHYTVDMLDAGSLMDVFNRNKDIVGVIHFAAFKAVGESVAQPLMYYKNNVIALLNLLECCEKFSVKNIVFSSSCTVYGQPDNIPVTESTPSKPAESPYGATKQMCERILRDFVARPGNAQRVCLLRYFNPAGAHPSGILGETPVGSPQNLVPVLVEAAAGVRPALKVFGGDYPTRDGTCVRDYIHVCDIATAHRRALEYIEKQPNAVSVFNLGAGAGVTVKEAIAAFEAATGVPVPHTIVDRRPGDVCAIYADNTFACSTLEWKLAYSLEDIMRTAWKYYKRPEDIKAQTSKPLIAENKCHRE